MFKFGHISIVALTLSAASLSQAAVVADFGTYATNPETTVGPDAPGYTGATPPGSLAVYGADTFTNDTVYNTNHSGFEGFNLPHVGVDPTQDVHIHARYIDDGGNATTVQFEFFGGDGGSYSSQANLPFDTSLLTTDFADYDLGSLASVSPNFNVSGLNGLQITGGSRTLEIDYIETRPTPEPAAAGVMLLSAGTLLRWRRR